VLFNESLIENAADFLSIYQALTAPLPNSIVCYIGSDEKIPDTYRNKVLHSDAIVTDLDTNEQMPLVIKYIRYAKRIHELFNG
jgi:fibrillarin-like rRNA methylase